MKVHYLMHVPHEALGNMETWFVENGHTLTRTRLYRDEPLPDPNTFDWLVVMGGPMGVYDEHRHAWLEPEKRFIEAVLGRDIPVLGICLGAQLIAEVLGAKVRKNPVREIGWYPVELTPVAAKAPLFKELPARFTPLHWHGDTFDIPTGAAHLASSEACEHQAFIHADKVLGLQFHLEALPSTVEDFCYEDRATLKPERYVQDAERILARTRHYAPACGLMNEILAAMARRVT